MNERLTHQGVRRPGEFKTNRLGLGGWIHGGHYPVERYLYTLHRISGLAILAYFFAHIIVTTMRLRGAEYWDSLMASFGSPLAKTGEFLVFAAFAFHALNGVRLVLTELGMGMGSPMLPIYPYKNSMRRQRPVFIVVMILALIVVIIGGYDFLSHSAQSH